MDAFAALKRGAKEAEASDAASKKWKTTARNDRCNRKRQKQQGLIKWIRPSAWMATPLELSGDVNSLIVEQLMRMRAVRTIKAFALVNRACAAAVHSTLASCRVKLKRLAATLEMVEEETSKRMRRRRLQHIGTEGPSWSSESSDDEQAGESDASNRAYDARVKFLMYMKSIGIHKLRGHKISAVPESVWFHDNKSLLGHLCDGCELCNKVGGVSLWPRGSGPVALFACDGCKNKGCVDITLEFTKGVQANALVARVNARETVANNYARALLSKRLAHRKRMLSKRAARTSAPRLGKRVHTIEFTDPLLLAYSACKHAMSRSPWALELWHELPKSIPQCLTFGGIMCLRNSDAVRDEAQLHSARRHRVRSEAAKRRGALTQMLRSYKEAHATVACITEKGYSGWIQVIDLCSAARAFSLRWMFKPDRSHDAAEKRHQLYKLLTMDAQERDVAVQRIKTVAEVVRKRLSRILPNYALTLHSCNERDMTLTVLRNIHKSCLESWPVARIDALVETLKRAPVCITLTEGKLQILNVCFALDSTFAERQLKMTSYVYTSSANRIAKLVGAKWSKDAVLNDAIIHDLLKLANEPLNAANGSLDACWSKRNEARTIIFQLPMLWPKWLVE